MSKQDRMRKRRARKAGQTGDRAKAKQRARVDLIPASEPRSSAMAERPTPERIAKGGIVEPTGQGAKRKAAYAQDMLDELLVAGDITPSQEQAGRVYQAAHAALIAELGVSGYRSCLDIAPAGHDAGDGNPAVLAEWRDICDRISRAMRFELDRVCVHSRRPHLLGVLRLALDQISS